MKIKNTLITVASSLVFGGASIGVGMLAYTNANVDKLELLTRAVKDDKLKELKLARGDIRITAGEEHAGAIIGNKVYMWGYNGAGQLGFGDYSNRLIPTLLPFLPNGTITSLELGANHSGAIVDGQIYMWGDNQFGQLGYVSDISSSEMCSYINQKSKNSNQLINNKELQEVGLLTVLNDGNYISSFSNRIIFPIIDQNSNIIGFTGRDINNNSNIKYLNSKNLKKDEFIYGLNLLDDTIEDLVICESMFDCLTLKQLKLNAISFMGIEYTAKQLSLLKLFTNLRRINICFDNDIAGIKAAIKLASDLKKVFSDISIRFFDYYQIESKDINEIYNLDEPMLLERLSRFVDYTTFYLNYLINDHKLNRNQKLQVLEKMSIKNSLYKNLMLQRLNECEFYEISDLFIDHDLLKDLILKNRKSNDGFLFKEIKNIYKIK